MTHRLGVVTLASLFALSLGVGSAFAAGGSGGPPDSRDPNPIKKETGQPKESTGAKKKKEQRSEQDFRDGYMLAFQLVQAEQYEAAFATFKQLDADDHPDVANYLGYTARKLGDYELSRVWYERALASDPRHVRTWQYYGMWHVEQGNKLKAADFLEQIRLICGTECKEYQDFKGGMEGTVTY
jgi:tetratricopeptide (TPR) repeat protein